MRFWSIVALITYAPIAGAQSVAPEQARSRLGQHAVVEGTVVQARTSRRSATTFLNFCRPYPNHCFVAVIFRSRAREFPNADRLDGKKVRVSGRVSEYQGKPQIVLERRSQLEVVSP